jgi:hypothetical protein
LQLSPWKYEELKKMPHRKFMEYYYSCILVPRWTPIWMNAHIVNANEVK